MSQVSSKKSNALQSSVVTQDMVPSSNDIISGQNVPVQDSFQVNLEAQERPRISSKTYYPGQISLPREERDWGVEVPGYEPKYFIDPIVIQFDERIHPNGWADPEDLSQVAGLNQSVVGELSFDANGRPLNPMGRKGISGRGELGRWGPNLTTDPIVTRRHPDTGELQLMLILRGDSGALALPGGFIDKGEKPLEAAVRELFEETGIQLDESLGQVGEQLIIDERRGTDNAWIESVGVSFHLDGAAAQVEPPPLREEATDGEVLGASWMTIDSHLLDRLHGAHRLFVERALKPLLE